MKRLHSRWLVKYMAFKWNMCAHKHELAYTFLSRVSGFIDLKRINLTCFACLFGSRSSNDAEQQQTQTQHDGVQSSLLAFAGGLWRQKTNHIYSGVGQGITETSESGNPDKADITTTLQLRVWTSVKPPLHRAVAFVPPLSDQKIDQDVQWSPKPRKFCFCVTAAARP